jgi:hypothetical protein
MPQMKEFLKKTIELLFQLASEDRSSLQPACLGKIICANLRHLRIPG